MRSTAITMVLGVCGILSFGCAEVKSAEKEVSSAAKEAEKSGPLKDAEKKVEAKVEGKSDKPASDKPASDAAGSADEKGVNSAVSSYSGVKASVSGGTVTLTGKGSAKDKSDAEAAVKKVKGVTAVTNNIAVGK